MYEVLASARIQEIRLDERRSQAFHDAVIGKAEERLGLGSGSFLKWRSNYMSTFYKSAGPEPYVLKVIEGKPWEAAAEQFQTLVEFSGIAESTGQFRCPTPRLDLSGQASYVMDYLEGENLSAAMTRVRLSPERILESCRDCGKALAALHSHRGPHNRPVNLDRLLHDLVESKAPAITPDDLALLKRTSRSLTDTVKPHARLHADFDPVNVLTGAGRVPVILDPPDGAVTGLIHWDLAVFVFGLERTLWRRPYLLATRSDLVAKARDKFLSGYLIRNPVPWLKEDEILLTFFECIRLTQLALFWRDPTHLRQGWRGRARMMYTTPFARIAWRTKMRRLRLLRS